MPLCQSFSAALGGWSNSLPPSLPSLHLPSLPSLLPSPLPSPLLTTGFMNQGSTLPWGLGGNRGQTRFLAQDSRSLLCVFFSFLGGGERRGHVCSLQNYTKPLARWIPWGMHLVDSQTPTETSILWMDTILHHFEIMVDPIFCLYF